MIELPDVVDYTLVLGIDAKHLEQLQLVWPTWIKHKPEFLRRRVVAFFDKDQVTESDVRRVIKHPGLRLVQWPLPGVEYIGDPSSKWHHPQRYKMLSGFVHVPAFAVDTPYWLKIDTDVVATGKPDWIEPSWFASTPAIVAHRWAFTKPAAQMDQLDAWVDAHRTKLIPLSSNPPLNLHPQPGSDRIGHRRIISWCGFFSTLLTRIASQMASDTVGRYQLPVPSQDGYLWYVATRLGHQVIRTNMKERGWEWWSTMGNIRQAAERASRGF